MRRLLADGHGRAARWLYLLGDAGFEDILLKACLQSQQFDRQVESGRGWYLANCISFSRNPQRYVQALIQALDGRWPRRSHEQQVEVLSELARRGNGEAAQAIESRWRRSLSRRSIAMADAWVQIAKADGYREVIEEMKRRWRRKKDRQPGAFGVHYSADAAMGKQSAERIRKTFARRAPWLAKIADFPSDEPNPPAKDSRQSYIEANEKEVATLETILGFRERFPTFLNPPLKLVQLLSEQELIRTARRALETPDPKEARFLLGCFRIKIPFPLEPGLLIPLTFHDEPRLRHSAFLVLENVEHPDVRAFGFDCLGDDARRGYAFGMFRLNLRPGDSAVLLPHMKKVKARIDRHLMVMDVKDIGKRYPGSETDGLILEAYEISPCSFCREHAAEMLRKRRNLPANYAQELLFDADDSAAVWAARLCRRRGIPVPDLPKPTRW